MHWKGRAPLELVILNPVGVALSWPDTSPPRAQLPDGRAAQCDLGYAWAPRAADDPGLQVHREAGTAEDARCMPASPRRAWGTETSLHVHGGPKTSLQNEAQRRAMINRYRTTLFLFIFATPLFAQDGTQGGNQLPNTRFGLFGGANIALHTAEFSALPGFPSCCPEYSFGFGLNPSVEAVYDLPLSTSMLLSLRAGFDAWGANLTQSEETAVEQNGVASPMTIEHEIRSNISTVGVSALLAHPVGERLRLLGGVKSGFVIGSDFVSDERIADESTTGTFENGERIRHEYADDIPGAASLLAGFSLGLSWDMPLNTEETWLAVPEITGTLGLIPLSSDVSWNAHSVRLGVAVMHAPRTVEPAPEPPLIAEPTPPTPPQADLAGTVQVTGISADGSNEAKLTLQIEEFVATDIRPMLGYIFFESGNAELPARYGRISAADRPRFDPNDLGGGDPLTVQYRSLDVIGYRMTEHPSSTIAITGTNDGSTEETRELSEERSESVKEYLTERWGIDAERIRTSARDLPATPSNGDVADGVAENRRAEISSSHRRLLAPVRMADTLRHASPPTLRFSPKVTSGEVASWVISAEQNGRVLKRIEGTGTPPETIDWEVDLEEGSMPRAPGTIEVMMTLTGPDGKRVETDASSITVEQLTLSHKQLEQIGNVEIERYSLILFDFDRADLGEEHRAMIRTIRSSLTPNSKVTVRGFTDRIGDPERNRRLALQRATNVAQELAVSDENLTIEAGEKPPYDNTTPEGRFYSRTVQIKIEHPASRTDVD